MATKFRFNYNNQTVDFEDYYVRSDIFTQGNLWSWGKNGYGQLGINDITHRSSPVQTVAFGINWLKVGCGGEQFAGIKSDGTLWVCGKNQFGQLGDNTSNTTHKSSPIQTISGGTNWYDLCCGQNHTVSIKTDGTLWLWGRNAYGQIGDNTISDRSSPVQTVTVAANWWKISAGFNHTVALKTDGTLWSWGRNNQGQLGDNSITNRSSPVQTVTLGNNWSQISCGYAHTVALKTDGTLWAWGIGTYGNLGDNSATTKSSPVQVVGAATNWKQISAGQTYTTAIKNDGTLWGWGSNFFGQLGTNDTSSFSSPVQTITRGTTWKNLGTALSLTTCATKTDGTIWVWGRNNNGQLGNNTVSNTSSPIQSLTGNNWKSISCGSDFVSAIYYV